MAFLPVIGGLFAAGGSGAAAAAGAGAATAAGTAAAGTSALATFGQALSIGAPLLTGAYGAIVASNNAAMARENARQAFDQGNRAAAEQDRLTRAALGEQLAVQSASGLSVDSGSSVLTRKATRTLGRQDALNARKEGDIASFNYKQQAASFEADAFGSVVQGVSGALGNLSSIVGKAKPYTKNVAKYVPNPVPKPQSLVFG